MNDPFHLGQLGVDSEWARPEGSLADKARSLVKIDVAARQGRLALPLAQTGGETRQCQFG